MAAQATANKKKFATCNLNQVLGAPKAATPKNYGPAVRSAAVIKPVAKPKGLISLGKAPPTSAITTRKGAAWSHLEEKAKERREEEDAKKDDLAKPDWAVLDYEDLEKPLKPDLFAEEGKKDEDAEEGDDRFPPGEYPPSPDHRVADASYSSARPTVTSEAASQTTADDNDWASSLQGERQFSKSQRSYLSMDYAPVAGMGEGEQGMASEPPQTHSIGVDATGQSSRRPRTQSWADTYGSDDDEAYSFPGSGPPAGDAPSMPSAGRAAYKTQGLAPTPSSSSMVPPPVSSVPAGPPPPRRPPPPGPPPPAQSDSRVHHIGAPRPVGPPPPMPPPAGPPPALARGTPPGPVAHPVPEPERGPAYPVETPASPAQGPSQQPVRSPKMMPQEEPRQRGPKFSPQEDPVVHSPQLSRHEDPRYRGPRAGPPDDRQAPPQSRHVEPQQHRPKATAYEEPHHGYAPARQPEHHRGGPRGDGGGGREHVGAPPAKHGAWGPPPRHPVPSAPVEPQRTRAPPGPGPASTGGGPPDACWGPAVAYTPAFAPRAPPDRPMSEDFVNSGWKEKKLWTPPEPEKPIRSQAPGAGAATVTRSRPRGEAAGAVGQGISGALDSGKDGSKGGDFGAPGRRPAPGGDAAEAAPPPKPPKPPKSPKGPLEVLDPDSSSSDESDGPGLPPEYAVLDMNVPRTALVINVSHVLKRLNGCCSLNQLTKSIKSFKDNTGVTLEAFLRANPDSFKLEGRIVHLLGRDGEKWTPPPEEAANYDSGKGKGKGKSEAAKGSTRKTEAPKKRSTGAGERQVDQWQAESWASASYGQSKGKSEARTKRGAASGGGGGTSWSSSGWSDWQGGWQSDRGWHW